MHQMIRGILYEWLEGLARLCSGVKNYKPNQGMDVRSSGQDKDTIKTRESRYSSFQSINSTKVDVEIDFRTSTDVVQPRSAYRPSWWRKDRDMEFQCCGPGDRTSLVGVIGPSYSFLQQASGEGTKLLSTADSRDMSMPDPNETPARLDTHFSYSIDTTSFPQIGAPAIPQIKAPGNFSRKYPGYGANMDSLTLTKSACRNRCDYHPIGKRVTRKANSRGPPMYKRPLYITGDLWKCTIDRPGSCSSEAPSSDEDSVTESRKEICAKNYTTHDTRPAEKLQRLIENRRKVELRIQNNVEANEGCESGGTNTQDLVALKEHWMNEKEFWCHLRSYDLNRLAQNGVELKQLREVYDSEMRSTLILMPL
ncbi:hypothetical protein TWF788_008240 [Orbilia oligospora]|uniref:Uncharacterized protein n=1 Tax=Orbilia oligospora TaxID=2813651 RepID=A0A7C8Q2P7_ORBOL|nr:hypothetical protein TWF788_008240 [Orbilia oligospora]